MSKKGLSDHEDDEINDLTADQLSDELVKLKKEQLNLRFQQASGQLENSARIKQCARPLHG